MCINLPARRSVTANSLELRPMWVKGGSMSFGVRTLKFQLFLLAFSHPPELFLSCLRPFLKCCGTLESTAQYEQQFFRVMFHWRSTDTPPSPTSTQCTVCSCKGKGEIPKGASSTLCAMLCHLTSWQFSYLQIDGASLNPGVLSKSLSLSLLIAEHTLSWLGKY